MGPRDGLDVLEKREIFGRARSCTLVCPAHSHSLVTILTVLYELSYVCAQACMRERERIQVKKRLAFKHLG
jgi:hypothetical protein